MRRFALIMATFLVVAAIPVSAPSAVRAQTIPPPTYSVVIFGETVSGRQVFTPEQILITQVPTQVIVTFHNNDTMQHTFTIQDENETIQVDTDFVDPGQDVTLEFLVETTTRIVYNGTGFTPEPGPDGILFYCIPHRGTGVVGVGMVGQIILATAAQGGGDESKGINIRAYWIGIIGIASMLVWIGISYFIIKSSSRHFSDHREHVRKGFP